MCFRSVKIVAVNFPWPFLPRCDQFLPLHLPTSNQMSLSRKEVGWLVEFIHYPSHKINHLPILGFSPSPIYDYLSWSVRVWRGKRKSNKWSALKEGDRTARRRICLCWRAWNCSAAWDLTVWRATCSLWLTFLHAVRLAFDLGSVEKEGPSPTHPPAQNSVIRGKWQGGLSHSRWVSPSQLNHMKRTLGA